MQTPKNVYTLSVNPNLFSTLVDTKAKHEKLRKKFLGPGTLISALIEGYVAPDEGDAQQLYEDFISEGKMHGRIKIYLSLNPVTVSKMLELKKDLERSLAQSLTILECIGLLIYQSAASDLTRSPD